MVEAEVTPWVATVLPELKDPPDFAEAIDALTTIAVEILSTTVGPGVVLFPAGWFNSKNAEPRILYGRIEEPFRALLTNLQREAVVCVGVDGRNGLDQTAIAVSHQGVISVARKYYPTEAERHEKVVIAKDHLCEEDGKSRTFAFS